MTLEQLKFYYSIDDREIDKRALFDSENARKTALKELIGEKAISKGNLWSILFPDYESKKRITSKRNQLDGIDYMITASDGTVYNIDLKCVQGDYSWDGTETSDHLMFDGNVLRAPIEIRQNGVFTNLLKKKTDFLLYIFHQPDGVYYSLLSYGMIANFSRQCDAIVCENTHSKQNTFIHHTSNNGTGDYVLFPAKVEKLYSF